MRIIPLDNNHEVRAVLETVHCLRRGGVAVIPTDTAYGLAVDAMNQKAIERAFAIKMRGGDKAMPIFASGFPMFDKVAVASDALKQKIAECDSVTAVLPARGWIPMIVRGGLSTVGVRIPRHPFVLRVLEGFGGPITGTSANVSGRGPHYIIQDVIDEFEGGVEPDIIIDAGDLPERQVSAVIDFTKKPPQILRTGPLPKHVLLELLGG